MTTNANPATVNPAQTAPKSVVPNVVPSLNQRAMLASLIIRSWSARKHDKRITNDVAQREHAAADAGRYNKRLLPKDALAFLTSQASAARSEHYKRTLPWSDEGARILSASGYLDYAKAIKAIRADFLSAADDFAARYPDFIDQAKRQLGNMFDPEDYPTPEAIRDKFAIELHVFPLPDAKDFRADLPEAELAMVRADIEEQVRQSLLAGQADVYRRISDALGHMVAKLRAYQPASDGQKASGIFRDTLVTNVAELAALIPSLNVTNDPTLAAICDDLHRVSQFPADTLRNSDNAREATANHAQSILDKVTEFLN